MDHILGFRDPRERMRALSTVPLNMSSAYEDVMKRIEESKKGDIKLALKILSWLFYAKRPLEMNELLEALVVEDNDDDLMREYMLRPDDVIECCKSLVVYESSSGLIRFTHYTVQEFLARIQPKLLQPVYLAKTCLCYLAFKVFDRHDFWWHWRDNWSKYRFLRYAATYWSDHTAGEAERSPEIHRALERVFASKERVVRILDVKASGYGGPLGPPYPGRSRDTFLHIVAKSGLETICRLAIQNRNNKYACLVLTLKLKKN